MRTLLAFCIAILAFPSLAQTTVTQKIGYADTDYIFTQLPEYKQVDVDMKAHGTQLQSQLEAKSKELETKYKAYQNMPATTPDAIRADKERELQQLQEGIQKFQQDAQASFQNKQAKLMEPLFAKVADAIAAVAKAEGYTFIISPGLPGGSGDILLYSDDKYDISDLVLKKLGITPTAAATPK
jgi:outer membrane protein